MKHIIYKQCIINVSVTKTYLKKCQEYSGKHACQNWLTRNEHFVYRTFGQIPHEGSIVFRALDFIQIIIDVVALG